MSLRLVWSNEQAVIDIPGDWTKRLEQLLAIAGEQENVVSGEVALTFVDDEAIRELNREYRGLDKPTDVLSFAMTEIGDGELEILYPGEDESGEYGDGGAEAGDREDDDDAEYVEPLGDIVISVPRALEQSREYGHSAEREIGFLFVHGFLHLIGYDHQSEEDERIMFAKQEEILQKAGLTR